MNQQKNQLFTNFSFKKLSVMEKLKKKTKSKTKNLPYYKIAVIRLLRSKKKRKKKSILILSMKSEQHKWRTELFQGSGTEPKLFYNDRR